MEPSCLVQRSQEECSAENDINHPPCGPPDWWTTDGFTNPPLYGDGDAPKPPPTGLACTIRRVFKTDNCSAYHNDEKLCTSWYKCAGTAAGGWSIINCTFTASAAADKKPGEGTCGEATTPQTVAEVGDCCTSTRAPTSVDGESNSVPEAPIGSSNSEEALGVAGFFSGGLTELREHQGSAARPSSLLELPQSRALRKGQRAWGALRASVLHRRARML